MIELKTLKDCINNNIKVNFLPLQVQEKITGILEMLDEAYETDDSRTFEGGKVIVLEDEQEALNIHQRYNCHKSTKKRLPVMWNIVVGERFHQNYLEYF